MFGKVFYDHDHMLAHCWPRVNRAKKQRRVLALASKTASNPCALSSGVITQKFFNCNDLHGDKKKHCMFIQCPQRACVLCCQCVFVNVDAVNVLQTERACNYCVRYVGMVDVRASASS
jgi:hypothetical protein